jgi:hypothetical protein
MRDLRITPIGRSHDWTGETAVEVAIQPAISANVSSLLSYSVDNLQSSVFCSVRRHSLAFTESLHARFDLQLF